MFDDFKEDVGKYINVGYGRTILYLYTENNIDKLLKPTQGKIGLFVDGGNDLSQFSTNFLNEFSLSNYQLVPIQDYDVIDESDIQKIVERLGNNVYVFRII